jgi:hypothetical protein
MCRNWISYMTPELQTAWGGPANQFTELGNLFTAAEALLQKAQDEAERTHVITVECQAAFKTLAKKMRSFRDRYFKIPPLTEGDWTALGFRARALSDTQACLMPFLRRSIQDFYKKLWRVTPTAALRQIIVKKFPYGNFKYVGGDINTAKEFL